MVKKFTYSDYYSKLACKDNKTKEISMIHKSIYVKYFLHCKKVLDLGCGGGIFMELLRKNNINTIGVDDSKEIVEELREKGFIIYCEDVLSFLSNTLEKFDGVFCSHLIEHFPFEKVVELIELVRNVIVESGIFVITFPNSESIKMQLNYFWKDPQHIRFYHQDLIKVVLEHYHFEIQEVGTSSWENIEFSWKRVRIYKKIWWRVLGIYKEMEEMHKILGKDLESYIVAKYKRGETKK